LVEKANQRAEMLAVRSPVSGTIIQPPSKPEQKGANEEEQLPTWSGNPFAPKNSDAYFAQSDLLCLVGDPQKMEAVLVVDQADIDLVREKQEVDMKIDSARLDTLSGTIGQISQMDMKVTPENLATQTGGSLDTEMDASGRMRPLSTSYQARVPLDHVDVPLRAGYRGQAKVYVGWKSIGWRFYRFLARTFRFEM
jgi:putative peptide zinc metalloprotease protein